ncbi:MAG TPA: glycosyltransferase family A protein [Saprospiraceae bacterium]|nr:glycosyltransferase family A protein [Saprospiraceae bacterium]HMQ82629.1 glycosyltransferase family A protein [Saprospiraceae bacterium]
MQQPSPLISILLPVFNAEKYLEACLASILQQSYLHWELWAVDDYSTDRSWEILQHWGEKDTRIFPLKNQESKGVIGALRTAFEASRGHYLTRMDADDLMPPSKLNRLLSLLQNSGPGHVATGKVQYFAEGQVFEGYRRYESWLNGLMDSGLHYRDIYRECVIPSPCWMVERQDFLRCGAFDLGIYPEDYDLCFRFYQSGLIVKADQDVLHLWRDHSSRSSRNSPLYADNRFLALKCHYFLAINYQENRPLVIWGAGKKGKLTAQLLQEKGIEFHWVCNTPSKWGKAIAGVVLQNTSYVEQLTKPQVLILVANPDEQSHIGLQLSEKGMSAGLDFYFFC